MMGQNHRCGARPHPHCRVRCAEFRAPQACRRDIRRVDRIWQEDAEPELAKLQRDATGDPQPNVAELAVREYDPGAVTVLRVIRGLARLGFTLDEISEL